MGLLSWLFGARQRVTPQFAAEVSGPGTFEVHVVGTSHYQDALEAICGGRTAEGVQFPVAAILVPEDGNLHDPRAVRVDIRGATVGHLSRADARQYRAGLKEAGHPAISVK